MVVETQRNGLRMVGTLPHTLPVTRTMDLGRGTTALARIREHHDAAECGDAGKVGAIGSFHPLILRGSHAMRQSGRLTGVVHNAASGWGVFMNITRGLVRLWVVTSGLWVIIVGLLVYDDVAKPYATGTGYYFRKDISPARQQAELEKSRASTAWSNYAINTPDGFVYSMTGSSGEDAANRVLAAIGTINFVKEPIVVERYSDAYRTLEEGITRGGVSEQIDVGVPDTVLFVGKSEPEAVKTQQAKEVYELASKVRNLVITKKRTEALKGAAWLALVPPAILFALGFLVLWVVRGFRAR
nr:hypothetical protein [Rhizobium leguminosarum]